MIEKCKEILEKQLDLLSEQSHTADNRQDVAALSEAMVNVAQLLCRLSQNLFSVEAACAQPYVGSLSMKDLIDLMKVRADRIRRLDDDLRKQGVVIRKET